jgi:hypothetical protein
MRKFAANVKSEFSNKVNGNISRLHIRFKSKKCILLIMFSVNARDAQITSAESGKRQLSIPGLRDTPIHYDGDTVKCRLSSKVAAGTQSSRHSSSRPRPTSKAGASLWIRVSELS